MLVDMGFSYNSGFGEFDEVLDSIIDDVKNLSYFDSGHVFYIFHKIIMVPFLYRAGVRSEWVREFIENRITTIHNFVSNNNYEIYDDIKKYKSIPPAYSGRLVIKPELYQNGNIQFPLEYDIYGFAEIRNDLDVNLKKKVDDIISYILDQQFQSIEDGYGLLYKGEEKYSYISMGWDPKTTDLLKEIRYNPLLLKLNQLAHFPRAICSEWFSEAMRTVSGYEKQDSIYDFPKEYLTEKDSIWILGNHMSMGENRRLKQSMTVEGTFWMLNILRLIENQR